MPRHATVQPRTIGRAAAAVAVAAVAGLGVGLATSAAAADPITCPAGQTSTKVADGWACVNGGGNTSNAEDPRNPNAGKGDY